MSDGLRDPDLPPGAVLVDKTTREGIRNDGKRLKPAAKNPWYLLATVRGEQTGKKIDEALHARNRRIWNGWACSGMDDGKLMGLSIDLDLPMEDFATLTDSELSEIEARFRAEPGSEVAIPKPSEEIDFSNTYFPMTFSMEKCVLVENAWIGSATFGGDADFTSTMFRGKAWFGSSTFSGIADFGSATFGGPAGFGSATFNWTTTFGSATFRGDAVFVSATFGGHASFGSATFSGPALFGSATFGGPVGFGSATFNGTAIFGSATFGGDADFSNKAFAAQTVFREAKFLGRVPKFFQRDLHQDTTFTTKDGYWPVITDETAEDAKQAYTRLRQVMNDLQKPDDEHFFFRQEMRCKARLEGRFYRAVSKAFEVVSDYGHSLGRPLGWLAFVMALPLGGYAVMLRETGEPLVSAIAKAAGLSFANTFAFFGFRRVYFAEVFPKLDALSSLIAGAQTVLGFVLLFFLGLGLRNRFRLK